MKQQIFASSMLAPPETRVNGQKEFITAGTFNFTVPAGVYSLSVALVASGLNGAASKSGNGGNLRYQNNIPVKPGQVIAVKVGGPTNPLTSFGELTSNSPLTASVLGGNGSAGAPIVKGASNRASQGGNVGTRPGVQGAGITLSTWQYTNAVSSASSAQAPGGGGGAYWGANDQFGTYYGGYTGAVRLIWGPGRSFPSSKIGNL